MKKSKASIVVIGLLFVVIFGISGCHSKKYPNPSDSFYVNDYARVLSAEVKDAILYYSKQLYKDSKNKGYGGTQVVVATFIFDDPTLIDNYRREEIYNQWKIGQNDMGLLMILYYSNEQFDGYTLPKYEKFEVAIGTGLTQYFNEIDAGSMYDAIFPLYVDEELALLHYYFEALHRIYQEAYPAMFPAFHYQEELDDFIDLFEEELYTFDRLGITPRSFLNDLFNLSFFAGGELIYILLGGGLLLLGGGFLKIRGSGGGSGGAGVFRRRK